MTTCAPSPSAYPTFRFKLLLFVIAGAVGGLAGALMVNLQNYVNPNLLHWTQSGTLMVMVILGGVGTVWGGLLGAAVLLIQEEAGCLHRALAVLCRLDPADRGAVRAARPGWAAVRPRRTGLIADGPRFDAEPARDPRPRQAIRRAGRHRPADLRCPAGEVHALIGPNGAGKTSLIAQIAGTLSADGGRMRLPGSRHHPLAGPPRAFAAAWCDRSRSHACSTRFQVIDNLVLAVQARSGATSRAWHSGGRWPANARCTTKRGRCSIWSGGRSGRDTRCDQLSHGEQRALEVALALATRPRAAAARRADGRHGCRRVRAHGQP
jgi:predicted ABC-type transport system involved in lysophospholipase L1 biosynthesis ATPase subunit